MALIQYIPYFSQNLGGWNDHDRLVSQQFTRQQIRRILFEQKDCLFIVMRSEAHWRSLIGAEMNHFADRFIYGKNPRNPSISEGNLGTENYNRVLELLRLLELHILCLGVRIAIFDKENHS